MATSRTGGEDLAYALMVLAREGRAAIGDLRYYADARAQAFATPLAQAQLGFALALAGDQPRADAMFRRAGVAAEAGEPAQLWRADYGSGPRDAAGVLALAVEAGSDAVDRRALTAVVTAPGAERSTQERLWTLLAAHALAGDAATGSVLVNDAPASGPALRLAPGDLPGPGDERRHRADARRRHRLRRADPAGAGGRATATGSSGSS